MKTLIVYGSKYGFTTDCVHLLQSNLSGEVTIMDIQQVTTLLNVSDFETVIIGGSVYVGRVSKKLREFCEKNLDALRQKRIGLFLCCALTENEAKYFSDNFPTPLLESAKVIKTFGSEARLEKMSLMDKTIIKAVTKGDYSNFKISEDNLEAFAKEMV